MRFSHYRLFFFFSLFSLSTLFGQDGKATIELNRNEQLQFNVYSKNEGLWVVINSLSFFGSMPPCKLYKFSPDLSKQEWSLEMKGIAPKALYDDKNPNYIYFRSAESTGKVRFFQVNKMGKLKTYEAQKEKDEEAKEDIIVFTSMNHLCELWTKKKNSNELVLVLHDNETLTKSKKIISLPNSNEKIKYREWYYAGASENLVALTRHEVEKEEVIQTVLIDMKSGKIVSHFSYAPTFKVSSTSMGTAPMDREKKKAIVFESKMDYNYSKTAGDIALSEDGKRFYHYGVIAYKERTYTSVNFVFAQLDIEGNKQNQEELTVTDNSLSGQILRSLVLEEKSPQSLKLEVTLSKQISAMTIEIVTTRAAVLFNSEGKKIDKCIKDSQYKVYYTKAAKSTVNAADDLFPCFTKNTDRMTQYIEQKKTDASYSVVSDDNQHIISVVLPKGKVLNLAYFKN